jgi:hypothetical protein
MTEERRLSLVTKRKLGYDALGVMEGHLADQDFFVANRYSIADIALYAYTHVADEGGFDLDGFPAVRAWLERVRSQPRHIPITRGCWRNREPGDANRVRALRGLPRRRRARLHMQLRVHLLRELRGRDGPRLPELRRGVGDAAQTTGENATGVSRV